MRRVHFLMLAALIAALSIVFCYEWRYSSDMREHIVAVNRDLETARMQTLFSHGLIGTLDAMTTRAEVGGEILDTHEYVHTLKDQILAWKVKDAAKQGITLGGAIQNVVAKWPEMSAGR